MIVIFPAFVYNDQQVFVITLKTLINDFVVVTTHVQFIVTISSISAKFASSPYILIVLVHVPLLVSFVDELATFNCSALVKYVYAGFVHSRIRLCVFANIEVLVQNFSNGLCHAIAPSAIQYK